MRIIKTFILRLVIDTEVPDQMCGDLSLVEGRIKFTFKSQALLEELLHNLTRNLQNNCLEEKSKNGSGQSNIQ
jgi:hypothetical protein